MVVFFYRMPVVHGFKVCVRVCVCYCVIMTLYELRSSSAFSTKPKTEIPVGAQESISADNKNSLTEQNISILLRCTLCSDLAFQQSISVAG